MLRQLLLALCFACSAWAAEVRLAWDPNSEPDLAGYRIHYGTASGSYTAHVDVGNVTTCTVPGLADQTRYYFAATAYDTSANESGYSNEVNWASGEPPVYIGATNLSASKLQQQPEQPMAFTLVQSNATIAYSRTTQALAFSSNVTAGSLLIASYSHWNASRTVTFTDSQSNDYTEITVQNGEAQATIGYAIAGSTGACTVTATISGGSADLCMDIAEFSATAAISFESSNTGTGSGTAASSNALTPAGDALYIGLLGTYNMSAITEGAGWSLINEQSGYDPSISLIYRTGSGAQTATWTITSREWTAIIAAFKEASGGGASAVPVFMRSYRARRQ